MTEFIDIKPGQWVLAFEQPYGPYHRTMSEHLESFAHHGGGWDSHLAREMFVIHQVLKVTPKGYMVDETNYTLKKPLGCFGRYPKSHVVQAFSSRDAAEKFRDKFFAIGAENDEVIETEMYRRIEKFSAKETEKAKAKIRRLLPQHFRGEA